MLQGFDFALASKISSANKAILLSNAYKRHVELLEKTIIQILS